MTRKVKNRRKNQTIRQVESYTHSSIVGSTLKRITTTKQDKLHGTEN